MPWPLIIAAAGMAISAYSAYSSGQAQKNAAGSYEAAAAESARQSRLAQLNAESQADIYQQNSRISAWEAKMGRVAGDYNKLLGERDAIFIHERTQDAALQVRRKMNDIEAKQVTGYLNAGVELSGTPALVMRETSERGEYDVARILETGDAQEADALAGGVINEITADAAAMRSQTQSNTDLRLSRMARNTGYMQTAQIPYELYQGQLGAWSARTQGNLSWLSGLGGSLSNLGMLGMRLYTPTESGSNAPLSFKTA
jgi:hypothetical protein